MCKFTLLTLILFNSCIFLSGAEVENNEFFEELYIKPLSSGHVYSHFEFTTKWNTASIRSSIQNYTDFEFRNYDLFPRALGEIIETYNVRELHLSFTQGLWRHNKWGYPIIDAPPGAVLWVWFNPHANVEESWLGLANALSGMLCASLNFIDSTNSASPKISYRPMGIAEPWYSENSSNLRYAALARENVCTENLTPWKKLLPCDSKAGLSALLTSVPEMLYSAHYHSLALHLRPACSTACTSPHLELVQSVSLVQKTVMNDRQDFSFRRLFSSPLFSTCPLAKSSHLYLDVSGAENDLSLTPKPDSIETSGSSIVSSRTLAFYDLQKYIGASRDTFDLKVTFSRPHQPSVVASPPLVVSRYLSGSGHEGGSVKLTLKSSVNTPLQVVYLELLPWYTRLYLHAHQTGRLSHLVPARDRERGWVIERVVTLPPKGALTLTLPFTRALLKWLEYPPDANHGFYLPAATISTVLPSPANVSTNSLQTTNLREKLLVQEGPSFVRFYTETLLVSLPTPDFSMPYNVICLACTVVALAFGPIHNITTKRLTVREEKASFKDRLKKWISRDRNSLKDSEGSTEEEENQNKEEETGEENSSETSCLTGSNVRKRNVQSRIE